MFDGDKFLLDTHVVIEVGNAGGFQALPKRVQRALEDATSDLLFSVVSEAEIAIKSRIGKLELKRDELALICNNASIVSYPLRRHHIDRLFANSRCFTTIRSTA